MNIHFCITVFLVSVFALITANVMALDPDATQYILLINEQVIEGIVDQKASTPDKVVIKKPTGSRIYIRTAKIVTIADSLSDIYWYRCGGLSPSDADGHATLFRWCVRQSLVKEAQNQIDLLQMMSIRPGKLLSMSEDLDDAVRRIKKAEADAQLAAKQPPATPATKSEPTIPASNSKIQQVGYTAPVDISERNKLVEKLERATESIHGDAVSMYKRKIEPLMINSCYTAKCHSNDSQALPLASMGKGNRIPKRMSQRNLYNILKYADFDRPLESPLLSAAALPHAGMSKPIVKINSTQFQNLRIWLIAISSKPFVYHPMPNNFYEADLQVQTDDELAGPEQPKKAPELKSVKKLPTAGSETKTTASTISKTKTEEPMQAPVRSGDPFDPFDPEVFNRRFLKDDAKRQQQDAGETESAKDESDQ